MYGQKTGGRKPGSKNKKTLRTEELALRHGVSLDFIASVVGKYLGSQLFKNDWEDLEPLQRLQMTEKLLNYFHAKKTYQAADVRMEEATPLSQKLAELAFGQQPPNN